jgi:diamine N-acetyltransferase
MSNILIRNASLPDAAYISLLARMTFTESFGHLFRDPQDLLDYYDQTFSVAKIRSSLQKENNVFLIAFVDELPVGYAKLKKQSSFPFLQSDKTSQLQKIYVLKDFVSKGIGKLMLDQFNPLMRELGKEFLWLSVYVGNTKAIAFYERNDFTPCGNHTFQIGKEVFEFVVLKKEFSFANDRK